MSVTRNISQEHKNIYNGFCIEYVDHSNWNDAQYMNFLEKLMDRVKAIEVEIKNEISIGKSDDFI